MPTMIVPIRNNPTCPERFDGVPGWVEMGTEGLRVPNSLVGFWGLVAMSVNHAGGVERARGQ